ncbi:hypothetical protein GUK30_32585 [Rhizobium leguminosarum]|uniref:hypothetical protein n=1 Tax=Rhizobium ruizarguesonis TaxID=2081791 RepID=UPI0013BF2EA3|nr:hypothetical protein [Rhizobium ruizarguesonis]NEI24085.1 hypothetical protein [Rhizobium ruizarguesonis]
MFHSPAHRDPSKRPDLAEFQTYLSSMVRHCPHLAPALKAENVVNTVLELNQADFIEQAERLFYEGFRAAHEIALSRVFSTRLCRNILFWTNTAGDGVDWENALLSIAHEALRSIFITHGVMFGKFWRDPLAAGRGGNLPIPPASFLSVRTAIYPSDTRFIDHLPDFQNLIVRQSVTELDRPPLPELPPNLREFMQSHIAASVVAWRASLS